MPQPELWKDFRVRDSQIWHLIKRFQCFSRAPRQILATPVRLVRKTCHAGLKSGSVDSHGSVLVWYVVRPVLATTSARFASRRPPKRATSCIGVPSVSDALNGPEPDAEPPEAERTTHAAIRPSAIDQPCTGSRRRCRVLRGCGPQGPCAPPIPRPGILGSLMEIADQLRYAVSQKRAGASDFGSF